MGTDFDHQEKCTIFWVNRDLRVYLESFLGNKLPKLCKTHFGNKKENFVNNMLNLGVLKILIFQQLRILYRNKDFCPSSTVTLTVDPLDSERGGLESSGLRLISSNGKTKIIAFFFNEEIFFLSKFSNFLRKKKRKKCGHFL